MGGRGLRGDCSLIRNRGICLVAGGLSGKADEVVVFAVGFHVAGVMGVVEGSVVRVIGVGEHGFCFVVPAADDPCTVIILFPCPELPALWRLAKMYFDKVRFRRDFKNSYPECTIPISRFMRKSRFASLSMQGFSRPFVKSVDANNARAENASGTASSSASSGSASWLYNQ